MVTAVAQRPRVPIKHEVAMLVTPGAPVAVAVVPVRVVRKHRLAHRP